MIPGLDPEIWKEILETYRVELGQKLLLLSDGLLRLEKGLTGAERQTLLEEIFRAAHSIKGASHGVGLEAVGELAHRLESLFGILKRGEAAPPAELIDLSLEVMDFMSQSAAAFVEGTPPSAARAKTLDDRLRALLNAARDDPPKPTAPRLKPTAPQPTPPELPSTLKDRFQRRAHQAKAAEDEELLLTSGFRPTAPAPAPTPAPTQIVPPQRADQYLQVPVERLERLGSWADEVHVSRVDLAEQVSRAREVADLAQALENRLLLGGQESEATRDQLAHLCLSARALQRDLFAAQRQLQVLSGSLSHDVRRLRLAPLAHLTRPLGRLTRELAREVGKQVELTVSGDDLEMDRLVMERVRDPLTHILRNAVDHGIEPPRERATRGKSETGRIQLQIGRQGDRILIRVVDDGAGIDPDDLRQVALHKGVITQTEAETMDRSALLELIFRPGFSSRKIITAISGRGVGLDAARASLRSINGRVTMESSVGHGTTFLLSLPLTMAAERGLMVRAGGRRFALPTLMVDHLLEATPEMLTLVEGKDALLLHGTALPLAVLADLLRLREPGGALPVLPAPVVVIGQGSERAALLVEGVENEREIVVKPLRQPVIKAPNVAGAAVLGGGQLVIVLDANDLLATVRQQERAPGLAARQAGEANKQVPRILVVDDSITTRTLETTILQSAGFQVTAAINGREAWELLQQAEFELVITDVQMPIMDGFELTAQIKDSPAHRALPVIIVSSLGREEDKRRGVEVGADAYIVKNQFETRGLLDVIGQLL